jgi:hypothetical protein
VSFQIVETLLPQHQVPGADPTSKEGQLSLRETK